MSALTLLTLIESFCNAIPIVVSFSSGRSVAKVLIIASAIVALSPIGEADVDKLETEEAKNGASNSISSPSSSLPFLPFHAFLLSLDLREDDDGDGGVLTFYGHGISTAYTEGIFVAKSAFVGCRSFAHSCYALLIIRPHHRSRCRMEGRKEGGVKFHFHFQSSVRVVRPYESIGCRRELKRKEEKEGGENVSRTDADGRGNYCSTYVTV